MKGLPGCGKSTVAKKWVAEAGPNQIKRINRDDLRAMIDGGVYTKGNEQLVKDVRDQMIYTFLSLGKHVIVDDTNLDPSNEKHLRELAESFNAKFQVHDMTDVPLETCLERNAARARNVPVNVIRSMHTKYIAKKPQEHSTEHYVQQNPDLPPCIIVDIDGTLAQRVDRSPYDWDKVGDDILIQPVAEVVDLLESGLANTVPEMMGYKIIMVSGRDESCRSQTEEWLNQFNIPWHELHMRPAGSFEKDYIVKEAIYNEHIRDNYYVMCVLDDRNQTVNQWRKLGLLTLQVWEGDF